MNQQARKSNRTATSPSPLAYLISFRCYGTWLHGDSRGSVDRYHSAYGTPFVQPDETRKRKELKRLKHSPVELDEQQRVVVDKTIREVSHHRNWELKALNVRSNHVHVVVVCSGNVTPESIMNSFKSFSTRRMVEAGIFPLKTKAWSRHGSTRYLWNPEEVDMACNYVVHGQETEEPLPYGRGTDSGPSA